MVEMIVVVAVIVILVTLVLPAASALWANRKQAETENAVQGLLMTSRARALQADGKESGFLTFVDDSGNQHLAAIERIHRDADIVQRCSACMSAEECTALIADLLNPIKQPAFQNVFVIRDTPDQVLPAPMRIVPRYVVDPETGAPESFLVFSDNELAGNQFDTPPGDRAQQHRNSFAVVFTTDGDLVVGRDVLVMDCNADGEEGDLLGDRTNLPVAPASLYFARDDSTVPTDPAAVTNALPNLVGSGGTSHTALNFTSVDGLLVYDDASFQQQPLDQKRSFLVRTGRPIYVSRYTGTVVRGPLGDTP